VLNGALHIANATDASSNLTLSYSFTGLKLPKWLVVDIRSRDITATQSLLLELVIRNSSLTCASALIGFSNAQGDAIENAKGLNSFSLSELDNWEAVSSSATHAEFLFTNLTPGVDYSITGLSFSDTLKGVQLSTVPEPSRWVLLCMSAIGLIGYRRRFRDFAPGSAG
jgi:hypothetical protein